MKIIRNICLYFTCIVLGFHITTGPVFAQILLTTLQDVLQSPDRYYAQQIKVKGKIVDVKIEKKVKRLQAARTFSGIQKAPKSRS